MLIAMRVVQQHAREVFAGELASLIGVEYLRPAVFGQCLLQRLDAEVSLHCDREPPGKNPAAEPVDNGGEIDESARHRDVGDVHRPDLVWADRPSARAADRDKSCGPARA